MLERNGAGLLKAEGAKGTSTLQGEREKGNQGKSTIEGLGDLSLNLNDR